VSEQTPYENLELALSQVHRALECYEHGDHMGVLRHLGATWQRATDVIGVCAELAYKDGATKKAMAEAIGCPVSVFRGMTR
jgi:hypothetical protein